MPMVSSYRARLQPLRSRRRITGTKARTCGAISFSLSPRHGWKRSACAARTGGFVAEHAQVLAIERGELAFELGIRARLPGLRGDAEMRVRAEFPVLAVGQVPELDRGRGIETRRGDRI